MTVQIVQNCLKCSLLCFSLLFLQTVRGQKDFSGVEQAVGQYARAIGPEVVVLVHKDGKTVYQHEGQNLKIKTAAPIASCSKWLTAALVMIMVDEGKLSLDDKVSKYIPLLENYSKGFITIRECLSHTTGIAADPPGLVGMMERRKFATLEEEVDHFITKKAIETNAGTSFRYSGVGLNMAARVLEIISKKSFDRLISEKLLRPLGMKSTTFTPESGAINPSGGAYSTAADYMNFLDMILNKGMFNGRRILSEESVAEMQKAQFPGLPVSWTPAIAQGYQYGLGEWIQEKDASGKTTVVSSPGLFGTWPWVDNGHQYTAIIFERGILKEQNRELYLKIKEAIDASIQ